MLKEDFIVLGILKWLFASSVMNAVSLKDSLVTNLLVLLALLKTFHIQYVSTIKVTIRK
jgi:hypothetical protein